MQLTFRCLPIINELIKQTVIAIDNYNNTLKEYDSIFAASNDLQINSGIIIYSCKNMHKPVKLKDILKIENKNDIKFNVFGVDDKQSICPLYISKKIVIKLVICF